MAEITKLLILPAITAAIIAFLLTPILIKLAPKLKILDNPARKHPAILHTKPIPRGGGIPVFIALLITSLVFLPLDQRLLGILIGAAVMVAIGFLDDRSDINPYMRIVGQIAASVVVVASGIGIAFISSPTGGIIDLSMPRFDFYFLGEARSIWVLSTAFGIFWIVFLMNAVSWSSGVDGQLSGFAAIAALVIAILSLSFSADITQWPVTILAAATAGAFFGFLPWHFYPQKIMPGFGGATLAGFMLAVLSILVTAKVGTLFLVLSIPIIDAVFAIFRRVLSGKSPVWGDRGHLHHKLLDAGWSRKNIALFYWLVTGTLGLAALHLNAQQKIYTIIGVALIVSALFLWLRSFPLSKQQDQDNG